MLVDVYQSAIRGDQYLAVPRGFDITTLVVPNGVYAEVRPFPRQMEFQPGQTKRAGVDADQAIADINTNGFAMFGAKITMRTV